ncbi:hypothetical protein HanHA300_Chr07g0249101 [Helianthus annuus]|nr:hypothetical protein HanHA300_Chr07g0249101 [Helianthus annuus]KAJ0563684.1 hypothetical protein HanHA89_Chr07g0265901 [Helianthus annuus]KAJ0729017.1 hypothetical protein HanLR1_Chr07g0248211 [Helianthus annuus]
MCFFCASWRWCDGGGGGRGGEVVVVVVERERVSRERAERERACVYCVVEIVFEKKKTNPLLLADCRHLGHIFSCRCLQMWFADYKHFTSEKTNSFKW